MLEFPGNLKPPSGKTDHENLRGLEVKELTDATWFPANIDGPKKGPAGHPMEIQEGP